MSYGSLNDKGRTGAQIIGEMFRGFFGGHTPSPKEVEKPSLPPVYNPLRFAVGGFVRVETLEHMKRTLSVEKICEIRRRIGKTSLVHTDYVLFDPDDNFSVTIRVIPNGDKYECLILKPNFESAYNDDLAKALEGDSITDNETQIVYRKMGFYDDVAVTELSKDGVDRLSIRYWDFINEEEPEARFYIVEMDLSEREGWIESYLGTSIAKEDVVPIAGHASAQS